MINSTSRIRLTLSLWQAGTPRELEGYIERLSQFLPQHHGQLERYMSEVDRSPARPDAVLVLSFPDGASVDSYLRDAARHDLEEQSVACSVVTDARTVYVHDGDPAPAVPMFPSESA